MDTARLRDRILRGQFDEGLELTANAPLDDLRDALVGLAFETESLACYAFCVAMAERDGARGHGLASDVLATSSLCRLPGAYQAAFFHAKRAVKLAPSDVGYREFLLFFHGHPEQVLSRDEAVAIARDLLELDPDNEAARRLLAE